MSIVWRLLSRYRRVLILALALLVGLAFQGTRHLWEPDEGRYTAVSQLMLQTGDWLTPRLEEDRPHYTKPPLILADVYGAFRN